MFLSLVADGKKFIQIAQGDDHMSLSDFNQNRDQRFPRDVTSQRPYQQRGVAQAQTAKSQRNLPENLPPNGDKPSQTPPKKSD